jgi:tape measure domain-containing protein
MAAPELRLDVRLNLATFRTDLGKAAQAAAAYYYPINLLINKQNLTKQLTAIGRSLGTTKYNIDLNDTSVEIAAGKIDKLAASLKKLSGSIRIDFNAGGGTKPLGTAMREMAAKLAKEAKGDINRAVEQMTGMRGASPFGAGTRSVPGFKAAAKGMGIENAFKLFFQELQQVDPQGLKKALDDGSVMMMQENREIKQKFDKIQSSAESLARDLRAMGETAKATGKASFATDGKTLYPQNYGLKIASLLSQVEKLDKDLRRVSTESGGELLNTLTELSSVLRTTSNSFVGIAGFSKNLDETLRGFDVATKAATKATTAYADRINRRGGGPAEATAGPRLLSGRDPGGALVAPLRDDPYRVIQAQVKNAFDIIEDYHKRQLNNFTSGYKEIIEDYHRKILIQLASVTEYRSSQKLLGGTPPRLALPPIGGATTPERQVRISTGAYLGQPGFMRAPFVPPSVGGGGGRIGGTGGGPGDFARRGGGPGGAFNIPKLPGAGLVREIGTEFGFAAKQVLLFGTAYKALAFIQGFPAQVGSAVGALQSFRNTLGAISPSAEEAAASSQFILDIVDKYNTPIQSARDGFTKLYASMKPTGFSGDEIRDLFLGISQAAATFGMSAEKVDRVNYAFAQMASKGQVMSEELKGQLGDVLPGAMGIFAEAAGFEGPDAITKFSKALEDGAYKGAAMKTLLTNVGIVMRKEFGPGAEGAARTFQGVINRMQNSFKLLYESFEPVAVGFLNSVVMPMTSGIKTLTDGFNAFFTGTLAKTEGGAGLAQQLNNLKPSFEGILANIQSLIPSFQLFGGVLFNTAKLLTSLAGNPIVGFLLNIYTNVLLVNTAFTLLGGRILLGVIASVNATIIRIIALDFAIKALGVQTMGAKTALAGTQLQMLLLQRSAAGMVGPLSLSNVALAVLAGKALLVAGGLALLGKAVYDTNETFRNFVNNIGGVIASDFKNAVDGMAKDAKSSANNIKSSFENLTSKLNPIGNFIKQLFKEVFQDTSNSAQNSATQSTSAFADFFNSLSSNATAGFNGLSAVIGNWWSSLPAPIRRIFEGNGVSMLVGAAQYVGSAGGRASQGKPKGQPERQGPYVPDRLKKTPSTSDLPPLATLPTGGGGTGGSGGNKGASDAKRLREEIARQAAAASDALFTEQQRLLILQQTNPIAEAFAKYTSQDLTIQKELNANLKEAKSEKEKISIKETARLQTAANLLDLERSINDAGEQALAPITELLKNQREELALTVETEKLMREGMSPERAKQVAQVRQLVAKQLESLDLSIDQAESAIVEAKARGASTEQVEKLIAALDRLREKRREGEGEGDKAEEGVPEEKPKDYLGDALTSAEARLKELLNPAYQLAEAAKTIGDSFGEAFKGIITGSMTVQEAFAGLFQSIADRFADMVSEMIARWLEAQLIKGFMNIFSGFIPGLGGAAGAGSSIEGQTGDFFTGPFDILPAANGAVWNGGFQAFANGGMVTGPTMGLVGEGRYNEAIVPLPDGKSIPVQLAGGDGGNQIVSNITVNVSNGQAQSNATGSNSSEMGRKIEGAVRQVIVGELRPGGLLASKK